MLDQIRRKIGWISANNDGVAAIEFSLLAVPFIFFVIGIMELSLMFAADALLRGAVNDAARLVRTGQIQQADPSAREGIFVDALCNHAAVLLNCNNIQYDVEVLDGFSSATMEPQFDDDGNLEETGFNPGGVSDVIMIRVSYLYPLMTPMIGNFFSDYPQNKKLLMATVVLQSEPYDFNGG